MRTIISTTDGKYLGLNVDGAQPVFAFTDWEFTPTRSQDLGNGYVFYSTTSYIVLTKEINNA